MVTALVVAWAGWFVLARGVAPSDDARMSGALYPSSQWRGGVVLHTVLDPRVDGLHKGDRVTAVQGQPLAEWMETAHGDDFEVGDQLTYTVERSGTRTSVQVTLLPYDWLAAAKRAAPLIAVATVLFVTACLILAQRSRDPAVRVLFAIAAVIPFGFPASPLGGQVIDLTLSPWPLWPQIVSSVAWALVWGAMIPHFALVFPQRPRVLERKRWIVPMLYLSPFLVHAVYLALTLPRAADRLESLERISTVSLLPERFAPVGLVALLTWSYLRTTDPIDRRRVAFTMTSLAAVFGLNFLWAQLPELVLGDSLVPYPANAWMFVLCPLAIAVSVLRSQLFDITVVMRRSLIALALAIGLSSMYVVGLWLLGPVPVRDFPAFLVGILVATLGLGIYRQLRVRVERRMYGSRGDPLEVVELLDRVEPGEPEHVLRQLVDALADSLRLAFVSITMTYDTETLHASHGTRQTDTVRLPLSHTGSIVGHIDVAVGRTREPFGEADHRLLAAIATHTAAAIDAARTNTELNKSRGRLLSSREEERRRIRRDLHDGVGSTLALLAMDLEVTRDMLTSDPAGAQNVLDQATARAQDAITEVRRTVNDLRPPVLDELGLRGAVILLADRVSHAPRPLGQDFTVTVEITGTLTDLEAAVEVAVYRILTEALNNASRHSGARRCWLSVERSDVLRIRVEDDGRGITTTTPTGNGLKSIRARAAELGGSAIVERRAPSGGCVVSARFPLDSSGVADDD